MISALRGQLDAAYKKLKFRGHAVPRDGEHHMPQLEAEAEVFVDRWGIPHIYARSLHDLFFLSGYVQAWDRLWQMDLTRRVAAGGLAEVLGPRLLAADRLSQRIGFKRLAGEMRSTLGQESVFVLDSYVTGVNAYLRQASRLPQEFLSLRYEPKEWTIEDVLSVIRLLAVSMASDWKLDAQEENKGVAQADAATPRSRRDETDRLVLPGRRTTRAHDRDSLLTEIEQWATRPLAPARSVAWSIGGVRTASGKPLLAGGSYLPASLPANWHQIHLSSGDIDVIGATVPGLPGVLLGHNRSVAWAMAAGALGPVEVEGAGDQIAPVLAFMRAQSWKHIQDALASWAVPTFDFVYADTAGDIGFHTIGRVPPNGDEQRPIAFNAWLAADQASPGYVAAGEGQLSEGGDAPARSAREGGPGAAGGQGIEEADKHTPAGLARLQLDAVTPLSGGTAGAGFRMICDLSNLNECYAAMVGGQSGDPLSPHYNDLTPHWLNGRMHRWYFARTDVVRHSESALRLIP
jgi:acyl-homoserine lactone acylase PvdQ